MALSLPVILTNSIRIVGNLLGYLLVQSYHFYALNFKMLYSFYLLELTFLPFIINFLVFSLSRI